MGGALKDTSSVRYLGYRTRTVSRTGEARRRRRDSGSVVLVARLRSNQSDGGQEGRRLGRRSRVVLGRREVAQE